MYTAPNPVYAVKQCGLDAALTNHRLQPTPQQPKNLHVFLNFTFFSLYTQTLLSYFTDHSSIAMKLAKLKMKVKNSLFMMTKASFAVGCN